MLKVVPVKKSSASDQVFEQLKDNLIQGTWKPGEKLASENELASLFGVISYYETDRKSVS